MAKSTPLAPTPISSEGSELSVSVRKVDNGYVKRVTRYSPGGGYESSETIHERDPGLGTADDCGLADAMRSVLGRRQ